MDCRKLSWDLSLRAQGSKASIANNIWLRGSEDDSNFGKYGSRHQSSQHSSFNRGRNYGVNFNSNLGINLERSNFSATLNESQKGKNFSINDREDLTGGKYQLLGVSMDGAVPKTISNGLGCLQGLGVAHMDCELEEEPFSHKDGKKRQRVNILGSNVSTSRDSLEAVDGHLIHFNQMKRLNRRLEELNRKESSEEILGEIVEAKLHLNTELDKEEKYWQQLPRANWLKMGDKNTAFFHKHASQRRRINQIRDLQRNDGSFALGSKDVMTRILLNS